MSITEQPILTPCVCRLSGVLDNYSARASIKSAFPNAQISIWEQAWIQDEIRSPAAGLESTRPVLPVLRKLLDVPEGVLIKEKINTCQLYGYRNLIWIRAVLVSLVSEFVFNQGSPLESNGFESDDSLRQCLEECKLSLEIQEGVVFTLLIQ